MSTVKHFKIFVNGAGFDAIAYEVTPVFFAIIKPNEEKVFFPWTNVDNVRLDKQWMKAAREQAQAQKEAESPKIEVPPQGIIRP